MDRLLAVFLICLFVLGCIWFDEVDKETGEKKKGTVTVIAEGASAAGAVGVPFAGIAGGVIGIIGTVGAWFKNRENKRNLKGMVALVEKIKPKIETLVNRKDLKDLIVNATEGTKFGKALKKAHSALKKI